METGHEEATTAVMGPLGIYVNTHTHTHTHTPVSYTHLDVYKRQVSNDSHLFIWLYHLLNFINVINIIDFSLGNK